MKRILVKLNQGQVFPTWMEYVGNRGNIIVSDGATLSAPD
jgi:hypothetical protein